MSATSCPLSIPTLDVSAESVTRALRAARAPAAAVAAQRPDIRVVLQAARQAARELAVPPHPDWLRHACVVRFAASAWPVQDFHRCVLSCIGAHWLGAGQPYGLLEEGPGVFQVVDGRAQAAAALPDPAAPAEFRSDCVGLRPAFRPEVVSLTCCLNHAHALVGVVDVQGLVAELPQGLRDIAMQERFRNARPAWPGCCAGMSGQAVALLRDNPPHGVMAMLDLASTCPARPGDAAALQVLREIARLARARANWLAPQPGEILFLRNQHVLHAERSGRGERRFLRAYWRQSLLALGNFAGTEVPAMYSCARTLRGG